MKAVIFDLDGTLADTLASIAYCMNRAIGRFGFAPFEEERYRYFVGDGVVELIRRTLAAAGDGELVYFDRVKQVYDEIFEADCMYMVEPYGEIVDLLRCLGEKGIRTAVLSNKPHERTLDVVHSLFGEDAFDVVLGQSPEVKRKPDPAGVYWIAERLGLGLRDILYVGDTNTDMETGKAAGVFTLGVLWGFRDREELVAAHADAVIGRPLELLVFV